MAQAGENYGAPKLRNVRRYIVQQFTQSRGLHRVKWRLLLTTQHPGYRHAGCLPACSQRQQR